MIFAETKNASIDFWNKIYKQLNVNRNLLQHPLSNFTAGRSTMVVRSVGMPKHRDMGGGGWWLFFSFFSRGTSQIYIAYIFL